MANIKILKKKLKTTRSTLKITSDMKLVSAAKMNKFQDKLHKAESYRQEMEDLVNKCTTNETLTHPILRKSGNTFKHMLVLSTDRGLCGSCNYHIANFVKNFIKNQEEIIRISFWGSKAKDILKFQNVGTQYPHKFDENFNQFIDMTAFDFLNEFLSNEVGEVYVAYNVYKGGGSYKPIIKKILPLEINENEKKQEDVFKYEPNQKEVLDYILPETFKSILYSCFLNAEATEHAARMVAMDNAAKNCKEAIRSLNLKINKRRQASITKELIEIVSGAETL